ncbi:MAG: DUF5686 family protein [Bacteroidota bacterium]
MDRFLLFLLLLLTVSVASAQSITVSGRVIDDDTREGIPFCNVYFKGTTIGVSSDVDGNYTITTKSPSDTLVVSAIGYSALEKPLKGLVDQEINFRVKSSDFTLSEVVVIAGENPANAIVRKIIKNKKKNRVEALDAFQCEAYTKVELDLDNISDKMRERKLFKPFEFIFENIDSTSDEKPFLPAYITETISNVYYVKSEGKPKEIPQAQRVSGVNNKTVIEFINQMHDEFSVYDNWIDIIEKPFASPFSNQGLTYYEYYIIDSAFIDGKWSRKLKFKPKRKQENTFYGDFWVSDTTFAIQRVNMRMSKDANINLINRVIIYQEFQLNKTDMWLPGKQKMVIDFKALKKGPGVIGRKTVSFKNYRVNNESPIEEVPEFDKEFYSLEDLKRDDSFWEEARHDKLSKNEASIYAMIDSIKNVPIYKTYVDIIYTLVSGFKELGMVEIGPYMTIYNNNPVEGHRFRLGVWTSNNFSKQLRFGGYLAYGLRDQQFKYGADFQYNLSKYPRIVFGASYRNDVSFSNQNSEEIGEGNIFSGIYRRPILQKLLRVEEGKFFYERFWKKGWSNKVTLLHQRMDPYGSIRSDGGGFNYAYLPNPEEAPNNIDTIISTTELIFKTRFALGEQFIDGQFFRTSLGSKHPIIELQYTAGLKGVLNGDYSYHKLALSYRHYFNIAPIGWLGYRLKAGKVFGQVPFLLSEVHPGNETYFYSNYIFNGMNNYEFASDTYVSLMLVHHFDGFFLNKIPLLRKLKWRSVVAFRAVYGTLSEENKEANQLNSFNTANLDTYTGFQTPDQEPYMEVGVGIENIFKIIRLDVLWRLNYLNNPEAKRLTYRAGLLFYF